MNLLELKSNINEHNTNSKVSSCNYELMDDLIEPGNIIYYYTNYDLYF